jgi:hypothetical protein
MELLTVSVVEYHLFAPTSSPIGAAQITALISSIIGAMITSFVPPLLWHSIQDFANDVL